MIQVGDLVKHRNLGGLGLIKRVNTVKRTQVATGYQAKVQWLINPYEGGGYTVIWTHLLEKSENK